MGKWKADRHSRVKTLVPQCLDSCTGRNSPARNRKPTTRGRAGFAWLANRTDDHFLEEDDKLNLAMKQLLDIAEIRTGYPFRGRIERIEIGGCRLVQMGDVRADTGEVGDDLGHVEVPANWQKHVLRTGDVLLVGRGVRNEAATFVGQTDDVIAAPHLFVLRVRTASLALPDYLTWFLNLPATQEQIRSIRVGSGIPFVPMEAFAQLKLALPSIEMQQRVVCLQRLCRQEEQLLEQISEQRRVLITGTICEAVRRETNH